MTILPWFRLDGLRALVTGAGRGIGRAGAEVLAAAGAHVVLAARSATEIETVARSIAVAGGSAETLVLDVRDLATVRALADGPPCDILLNNAGTNAPMPITDVCEQDFDYVIGLNLKSALFVAQAVAIGLIRAARPGSLIHLSSQFGHVAAPGRTLYCASKFGLEGFSKALALDLAPHGIRSNTIAPTYIETPLTRPLLDDAEFRARAIEGLPLGRIGSVEDVTGAILYLASGASALVTGTSLRVDGGWTAR